MWQRGAISKWATGTLAPTYVQLSLKLRVICAIYLLIQMSQERTSQIQFWDSPWNLLARPVSGDIVSAALAFLQKDGMSLLSLLCAQWRDTLYSKTGRAANCTGNSSMFWALPDSKSPLSEGQHFPIWARTNNGQFNARDIPLLCVHVGLPKGIPTLEIWSYL